MIKKFNFKTPGREDDDAETKLYTKADVNAHREARNGEGREQAFGGCGKRGNHTEASAVRKIFNGCRLLCDKTALHSELEWISELMMALLKATGAYRRRAQGTRCAGHLRTECHRDQIQSGRLSGNSTGHSGNTGRNF